MDAIDTKAVINAEVITLSRMAHIVLQEIGGNIKQFFLKNVEKPCLFIQY